MIMVHVAHKDLKFKYDLDGMCIFNYIKKTLPYLNNLMIRRELVTV